MTVESRASSSRPATRNPDPVTVTNLVATLRGTQAESADRIYVVSGHYDSRCTDALDSTCDAPGANDDASGVAAVLELARVMAKRKFDATIVFMAVAGEEQGLFGSTYFAAQAKARRHGRPGHVHQRHRRQLDERQGPARPVHRAPVLRGRADHRDAGAGRAAPVDRRRERRPVAPARALRQGGRRELGHRDARAPDLAARPLPARRRPDPVPRAGLPGGALHRAGRGLRPPAPGRPRRERRAVRRPAAVRRLRLHRARVARVNGAALANLALGADGAEGGRDRHHAADQRHRR